MKDRGTIKHEVEVKVGDTVRWDPDCGVPCPHNGETMIVEGFYPPEKDPQWRGGETKDGSDMRVMARIVIDPHPTDGSARVRGRIRADKLVKV